MTGVAAPYMSTRGRLPCQKAAPKGLTLHSARQLKNPIHLCQAGAVWGNIDVVFSFPWWSDPVTGTNLWRQFITINHY